MTADDKNILGKIEAGKAEMARLMVTLDDLHLEQTLLEEGDAWVESTPYRELVQAGIAANIAERRASFEWKYKQAAISVWMYRIEAKRRGLL
jgi:hypothetical protein